MSPPSSCSEPSSHRRGHWLWELGTPGVSVLFVGRGPQTNRDRVLDLVVDGSLDEAGWCHQIHSDRVVQGRNGYCGKADALWTSRRDLALCVSTADCVPVVLAGEDSVAVVHAGWRGIAANIVAKTVAAFGPASTRISAWIGPAIGPCCYEVGVDVAQQVAAQSTSSIIAARAEGRPRIDLPGAVRWQLAKAGVESTTSIDCCTRCNVDWLWSYRRDGDAAGRNLTFAWLRRPGSDSFTASTPH